MGGVCVGYLVLIPIPTLKIKNIHTGTRTHMGSNISARISEPITHTLTKKKQ